MTAVEKSHHQSPPPTEQPPSPKEQQMGTASPIPAPGLPLHLLPFIDMTSFSQSELHTLSLCSPSSTGSTAPSSLSFSVDHSTFNESAGSRRQTYSRPSSSHHHRHRLPKPHNPTPAATTATTTAENQSIIAFLKGLLSAHPLFQQPNFNNLQILTNHVTFSSLETRIASLEPIVEGFERKRKRGRKPKKKVKVLSLEERERVMGLGVVDKNGNAVDLVKLGNLEDPYKEELRRRTEGLESEEELLGFFKGLDGQWCSRRRKRRIVDASQFGDTLPRGWNLLLGLKRKEGRTWVYCRRYMSPGGQHFVSCKDVSAYLQSFLGQYDAQQPKVHSIDNVDHHRVVSDSNVDSIDREEDQRRPYEHEKDIALLEIDNLAEVQIYDLFECQKCRMTFEVKDTYLQHLLSFHQMTTRSYRLGSSVGDGVIVKEGKYECQFCHKVFDERRRYYGHVGVHVRNYVRGHEESPAAQIGRETVNDSLVLSDVPARISKMDALIEIAQNSILETTSSRPNDGANGGFTSDQQNVVSTPYVPSTVSYNDLNFDSSPGQLGMEDDMVDEDDSIHPESTLEKGDPMMADAVIERIESARNNMVFKMDPSSGNVQLALESCGIRDGPPLSIDETDRIENLLSTEGSKYLESDKIVEIRGVEIEVGFESNSRVADTDIACGTGEQSPVVQLQQLHDVQPPNAVFFQGENQLGVMNQRHDKVTGFEELRLEDIEELKYGFGAEQEPLTLHEVPLELDSHSEIGEAYDAPVRLESEVIVDVTAIEQLTTLCVWCGSEFSYEAVDTELQSGTVGYMCPSCKGKVSGQLNLLDDGGCF